MKRNLLASVVVLVGILLGSSVMLRSAKPVQHFQTSDRCMACHNSLVTDSGEDVSIGTSWRATMMANSARDPYWQSAVRRETMDHPESRKAIEDTRCWGWRWCGGAASGCSKS